jgi:hypothetical protein
MALVLATCAPAIAGVTNMGFETGDFTGWQTDGNVAVVTAGCSTIYPYHCANPAGGTYMALLTAGSVPISQLSADLGIDLSLYYPSATYGSAIWQTFYSVPGTPVSFAYNFLGNDYLPFNDAAAFTTYVSPSGATYLLTLGDIGGVGNYGTTGWQYWSATTSLYGYYTIGFVVFNDVDNVLNSQLLVDTPEPTTMLLAGSGILLLAKKLRKK